MHLKLHKLSQTAPTTPHTTRTAPQILTQTLIQTAPHTAQFAPQITPHTAQTAPQITPHTAQTALT